MNLPKVKFVEIPLSKEIDWIYGFLFQKNGADKIYAV